MATQKRRFVIWVILLGIALTFVACAKKEPIVAKVGRYSVTAEDFKNGFIQKYRGEEAAKKRPFDDRRAYAEELANQARHLQHIIAFFKIEEASLKHEPERGQEVISPHLGELKERKTRSERVTGESKAESPPAETPTDRSFFNSNGDERDAEFESY